MNGDIRSQLFHRPWRRFVNNSSSTAPVGAVMRPTTNTVGNGEIVLSLDQPNTTFYREYWVNIGWATPNGKEGICSLIQDGGYVLYESGTPAVDEGWGPKSGQWSLAKWRYGFTIKGATKTIHGNGAVFCTQATVVSIYGQTQGTIADGATGTVEVFDGNNTILHASTTVSAVHRFSATTIGDDKKVECHWNGGTWIIGSARC